MNDIIVGVDRSETARRAVEAASDLAEAYGVNLHVVMCVDRSKPVDISVGSEQFRVDALSEAGQFLDDVVRRLSCASTTRAVGVGDPAKMMCEEAERLDARTIVVGNRRVQGVGRVLGSVASNVTKWAPCDVLVANTSVGA